MILSIEGKGSDGGGRMGSGKREQRIFKSGMDFEVLICFFLHWDHVEHVTGIWKGTDMLGTGAMVKKMLVPCMKYSKPTVCSIDVAFPCGLLILPAGSLLRINTKTVASNNTLNALGI